MRLLKIMLIAGVIAGISLLSLNCAASKTAPQYPTAAVQRGNLTVDITGVGNLALSQKTDLAFEIAGTVAEVLVEAGDTVEKGQVLAKLDTSDWETQLSALEDKVTAAERQVTAKQRAVTTAERQLATKKDAVTTAGRLLATKKDAVTTAGRLLATKKDAVTTAGRLLATKKDAVTTAERLLATKKRQVIAKERDVIAKERDVAQAELDLKDAQTALDTTQITYTEADFIAAQAAVDAAQTEVDKAVLVLAKYEPGTEGYTIKQNLVTSAQSKLKSAQAKLEAMSSAFDDKLASNQKAVETAQWNLETARIAVGDAWIAVEDAQLAIEDAQKAIETAQLAVEDAQLAIEDAQLAIEDAQKAIETAQLAVEDAQKAIETTQLAVEDAQKDIEDAQLAVKDAQKALADARKALADAQKDHPEIIAPSAGFITSVNVKGGDEVKKGTVAMTLADPNKFEADILVNETDILQTRLGGNASVLVEAVPGMSLPAKVTHIAPTATIQSGVVNYKVKVELESLPSVMPERQPAMGNLSADNITSLRQPMGGSPFSGNVTSGALPDRMRQAIEGGGFTQEQIAEMRRQRQAGQSPAQMPTTLSSDFQLREGQTVTVSILVAERNNVLLVPNGAITRRGMESMVKVLKDGVVEERAITTGISNWQYTEVSGGLSEGETVVIPQTTTTTPTTPQQGGTRMIPGPGMGGFGR